MNQQLEQYLGDAEQKLQSLPPARRQEELEEIRQHLVASIQAHEESGLDTDAATKQTILQFGMAQQVGSGLQKAWWREQVGGPRGLWKTAALSIGLKYAAYGLFSPVTTLMDHVATKVNAGPTLAFPSFVSLPVTLLSLVFFLPCILAGVALARISPRNAIMGCVIGSLISLLASGLNMSTLLTLPSDVLRPFSNPATLWSMILLAPIQALIMFAATWLTVRIERKKLLVTR